jgi:hypothetical protein
MNWCSRGTILCGAQNTEIRKLREQYVNLFHPLTPYPFSLSLSLLLLPPYLSHVLYNTSGFRFPRHRHHMATWRHWSGWLRVIFTPLSERNGTPVRTHGTRWINGIKSIHEYLWVSSCISRCIKRQLNRVSRTRDPLVLVQGRYCTTPQIRS